MYNKKIIAFRKLKMVSGQILSVFFCLTDYALNTQKNISTEIETISMLKRFNIRNYVMAIKTSILLRNKVYVR